MLSKVGHTAPRTLHALHRVTTCLENLEMSGNYTDVREMSGISLKSGKCQGKLCDFYNFPF